MAKKQVYGQKASRGLCPVCGEQIQHIKVIKPFIGDKKHYKFNDNVVKVCKCPSKTLDSYLK
ncbi:MAG: hypothetical protein KAS62_06750 [Candidatus Delongbacteria bacterium]|nr:hypothetical protein [Candidatus Delongbacteria bacterium]